ncbi:MAG TPA: prolyl oligopeptidase family serine peptidase [Gemmataceae bacterium]|nr:prolyl oligopeptidase family serine peptidase [Gemmataceae bacterium]
MVRFRAPALVVACLLAAAAGCAKPATGFQTRLFRSPDGQAANYTLFVPHGYDPDRPAPVILFLHGAGEAGTDGEKPTQTGLGPAVRAREATFPFLAVFPQVSDRLPASHGSWRPGQPDAERALAILDEVCREYRADPNRVYLTGVSVGGTGLWQVAAAHPDRWAAIVPVCGYGPVANAAALKDLPCWCFHGADDGNVPVERSREMVSALRRAGGNPRYTEYPGVGHNSWEKAYETDELYEWLLAQARK